MNKRYENYQVSGHGLPAVTVLVNVNHDDPLGFAEREYRAHLAEQGVLPQRIHMVKAVSYGLDGVSL